MVPWKIVVLSGASGSGKTTCIRVLESFAPAVRFCQLPSVTTRAPRPGDEPWYEYVDLDTFRKMKSDGKFLWIEAVHGNLYGTTKDAFETALAYGDCLLASLTPHDIPTIAMRGLDYGVPLEEMLFLYIRHPGDEVLRKRLEARGDAKDVIERRIADCANWDGLAKDAKLVFPRQVKLDVTFIENDTSEETFAGKVRTLFT
ncbi:MAG TPA: hypothetical protein VFS75_00585 [Candidatus Paceibacterota bacterium]|nr:hypothetical protein [Candidatus Paceibacterota bacterium]